MALAAFERTHARSRPSQISSKKLFHISILSSVSYQSLLQIAEESSYALSGSIYFRKCTCRYIHPLLIKSIMAGISLLFLPPLLPPFWNAIKQDIHGKQSSCQKAKWKPCVCTQPPSPSARRRHFMHVNAAQKIASNNVVCLGWLHWTCFICSAAASIWRRKCELCGCWTPLSRTYIAPLKGMSGAYISRYCTLTRKLYSHMKQTAELPWTTWYV